MIWNYNLKQIIAVSTSLELTVTDVPMRRHTPACQTLNHFSDHGLTVKNRTKYSYECRPCGINVTMTDLSIIFHSNLPFWKTIFQKITYGCDIRNTKIPIWGWQTPQFPRPEKAPKSEWCKNEKKRLMIKPWAPSQYKDRLLDKTVPSDGCR